MLPMCGSSNPDVLLKSERSNSVSSSPEFDEPLFQFSAISPQTNKTLTTVATIRTRRERKAVNKLIALADGGDFFGRDVLVSERNLDVDRTGFSGTGSFFGVASETEELTTRGSATGSTDRKRTGSAACESPGTVVAEIDDNTASEHHSGSIFNFDSASDTAISRKTKMSLREIGGGFGKL